jgi:hypothetical protein
MNQIFYIKCTKTIKGMNYKNALDSLNNWKLVEVGKQLGLINFLFDYHYYYPIFASKNLNQFFIYRTRAIISRSRL